MPRLVGPRLGGAPCDARAGNVVTEVGEGRGREAVVVVGEHRTIMVVARDGGDTGAAKHLGRVAHRFTQEGERRGPLVVDVLREEGTEARHQIPGRTLGRVAGVDPESLGAAADPVRKRGLDGLGERGGMLLDDVRIRALSVFEGVVYHCFAVDLQNPCRPTLEVDARTLPGDLDAGPLLVTVADWRAMLLNGGLLNGGAGHDVADTCLPELKRKGRLVEHQNVLHIQFPTWSAPPER